MNLHTVLQLEEKFIKETFDTKDSFLIKKGKHPIILSAPHSTTHFRFGKDKIGEYRTGCIVDYLALNTNCHGIYKTKHNYDDPNHDEHTPYKDNLIEYIKQHDIKYLIDLHMMSPKREHLIEFGTGHGNNIKNKDIPIRFKKIFEKNNITKIETDKLFCAAYPHTISASISRICGIDCIQIEANWHIFDIDKNGESLLQSYINALLDCIKYLKEL